eukprot:m.71434 g.71434  ORF g.71434 m.71434 type:complete len:427 (+) comp14216_c0_seq2:191-1471(+)
MAEQPPERSSDLIREGWLYKVGDRRKSWKKRWFVITNSNFSLHFSYYKSQPSKTKPLRPLGSFELHAAESFRLLEPPMSPLTRSVMEVITPKRTYQMYAASEQECLEWAWAIERSIGILRAQNQDPDNQATVAFSGFLKKKGGQRHNWKTRWFNLTEQCLQYFTQRKDKLLGHVALTDCLDVCRVFHPEQYFQFHIRTAKRTYMFRAPNEGELVDWLHALSQAGCPMGQAEKVSTATFYADVDDDSDEEGDVIAEEGSSPPPFATATSTHTLPPNRHRSITAPASRLPLPSTTNLRVSLLMPFAKLHATLKPHCLTKADLIRRANADPTTALPLSNPFATLGSTSSLPDRRRATLAVADTKLRPARSADSLVRRAGPKHSDDGAEAASNGTNSEKEGRQRSLSLHNPFRELTGMAEEHRRDGDSES